MVHVSGAQVLRAVRCTRSLHGHAGNSQRTFHKGAQGDLNKKELFCLVILWEGNPHPKLSSFQYRNSHRSVVFTRGCHRVALEGGWNDLLGRFPSGEQQPLRAGCSFWPRCERRWPETSGRATAGPTASLGCFSSRPPRGSLSASF